MRPRSRRRHPRRPRPRPRLRPARRGPDRVARAARTARRPRRVTMKQRDAREVLGALLEKMGIAATIEVREEADRMVLDIHGDEAGLVIGKKGATLEALQFLVAKIVHRGH